MPTIPLPERPSVVQLRKLARELQRRIRSGATEVLNEFYPNYEGERGEFPLNLAQLVLARRFGFTSWPRLVAYVEMVRGYTRVPDSDKGISNPADRFLAHAVLRYGGNDGPDRWAVAEKMLTDDPPLSTRSIWTASATGNHEAVQQLLAADPTLASKEGGPFEWEPLLYLTYSRLAVSLGDALTTAGLLLQAGADPNTGYLWHGYPTPFTALTGAFGNGEQGLVNQPPHPHELPLARLLLSAGAEANDGQALYNRMFGTNDDHLRLLFDFGLGTGDGGPWKSRMPEKVDSPRRLLSIQLGWAVSHGMQQRVALLAEHGVDLNAPVDSPYVAATTPLELAGMTGQIGVHGLLLALGADPTDSAPDVLLVTALLAGNAESVDRLSAGLPEVHRTHPALILRAAAADRIEVIESLVAYGFDVNAYGRSDTPKNEPWETALHHAAYEGKLEIARLLLQLGADTSLRDQRFDGTPLNWAQHGGQPELIALLEPLTS